MNPDIPPQPLQSPINNESQVPASQPLQTPVVPTSTPLPTSQPSSNPQPIAPQVINGETAELKKSKFPIFLLFFFLVLALGMGGYYVYQKYVVQNKLTEPTQVPTTASTSSPIPTEDPTTDWKTYINTKNGYTVKYPDTFVQYICPDEELTLSKKGNTVSNSEPIKMDGCGRDSRYTLETKTYNSIQKEPEETKYYTIKKNEITLSGLPAEQYIFTFTNIENGPFPLWYTIVQVNKNGKTYEIYFDDKEQLATFNQILSTFNFLNKTSSPSPSPLPTSPAGWKPNIFSSQKLTIYTPSDWVSSIEDFTSTKSSLIKFWKKVTPGTVPIQLDIKPDWTNTGNAKDQIKNYTVGGFIDAYKLDPPKKEAQTLERYQTNVYFEYLSKVYVFTCVHNWVADYVDTCNKMLETLTFTK